MCFWRNANTNPTKVTIATLKSDSQRSQLSHRCRWCLMSLKTHFLCPHIFFATLHIFIVGWTKIQGKNVSEGNVDAVDKTGIHPYMSCLLYSPTCFLSSAVKRHLLVAESLSLTYICHIQWQNGKSDVQPLDVKEAHNKQTKKHRPWASLWTLGYTKAQNALLAKRQLREVVSSLEQK